MCIRDRYTDKAKGILTEQRFVKLTVALEQEQESNQKRLHDLAMMQGLSLIHISQEYQCPDGYGREISPSLF